MPHAQMAEPRLSEVPKSAAHWSTVRTGTVRRPGRARALGRASPAGSKSRPRHPWGCCPEGRSHEPGSVSGSRSAASAKPSCRAPQPRPEAAPRLPSWARVKTGATAAPGGGGRRACVGETWAGPRPVVGAQAQIFPKARAVYRLLTFLILGSCSSPWWCV